VAKETQTVIVNAPITDVFAFLADGLNNPKWRSEVKSISLASGSGATAIYQQTMAGPGGRDIRGDYRVSEFTAPKLLSFEVIAGPARPSGRFDLTEVTPSQTELTFTIELIPTGFMKLMGGIIAKQVKAEVSNIARVAVAMGV